MNDLFDEKDLMKTCSDCGSLKMKTVLYFRNINQKIRKKCAQCTKIKQRVYNFENKEKNKMYAKQNKEKNKEYKNYRCKTDINFQLIRRTRSRLRKVLRRTSKSSSTKEILGIDIETCEKWLEFQMTSDMT